MVFAGFGALGFLCGKIFPPKPAKTKVAEEEAGEETATDENKDDGNKNASKSFSFSSLLGLIAAICGIVSLYTDSNSGHLYRTYQTFIALSLIGLIPMIGVVVLGTCAFLGSCLCACCKTETAGGCCKMGAMTLCVFIIVALVAAIASALNCVILGFGWQYAFGNKKVSFS